MRVHFVAAFACVCWFGQGCSASTSGGGFVDGGPDANNSDVVTTDGCTPPAPVADCKTQRPSSFVSISLSGTIGGRSYSSICSSANIAYCTATDRLLVTCSPAGGEGGPTNFTFYIEPPRVGTFTSPSMTRYGVSIDFNPDNPLETLATSRSDIASTTMTITTFDPCTPRIQGSYSGTWNSSTSGGNTTVAGTVEARFDVAL